MRTFSGQIALTAMLGVGMASFVYAIDRVGTPSPGDTTTSSTATIKGELLKIEGGTDGSFYTVKDTAGREVRLHVNKDTKMDAALRVGDKVEAQSNPGGHATYIKKASGGGAMGSESGKITGPDKSPEAGKSAESGKDLSTPSKMDSGAPGTPGGATPGTSSGTEPSPK
jgi:hypothetical protein